MSGDVLLMELGSRCLALDTAVVASIAEAAVRHLPGSAGFIAGVISFRGDPVVVVDLWKAFGAPGAASPGAAGPVGASSSGGARRVVVVREGGLTLGLDIGLARLSFLWENDLKGAFERSASSAFSSGVIVASGRTVDMVNWRTLFDEAASILSAQRAGV